MATRSRWVATEAAAATWRAFRSSFADLPPGTWQRWGRSLALGFVAALALLAASTWTGEYFAARGMAEADERLLRQFIAWSPLSFDAGIWWESLGSSAVLLPLVVAAALVAARARRPLVALSFPIGYIGIKALVYTARALWNRPRPGFVEGGVAVPDVGAYPSGHALNVLVIYGLLVYLWVERSEHWTERATAALVLLALFAMVSWARLRLGAHWPSDVAAGLVVGLGWLGALVVALRRAGSEAAP